MHQVSDLVQFGFKEDAYVGRCEGLGLRIARARNSEGESKEDTAMERIPQPFMGPCCRGYGRGDLVLTRLGLGDLPHDKFLVESRIGRHLFHATTALGSGVKVTSYPALLALLALSPLRSPAPDAKE